MPNYLTYKAFEKEKYLRVKLLGSQRRPNINSHLLGKRRGKLPITGWDCQGNPHLGRPPLGTQQFYLSAPNLEQQAPLHMNLRIHMTVITFSCRNRLSLSTLRDLAFPPAISNPEAAEDRSRAWGMDLCRRENILTGLSTALAAPSTTRNAQPTVPCALSYRICNARATLPGVRALSMSCPLSLVASVMIKQPVFPQFSGLRVWLRQHRAGG